MGGAAATEEEESGGGGGVAVEANVGTIVWVRRRNGSWWPGRILGPEELPESTLMSPRTGTPVKLLGREDASVDWYNLEKSKRVKAFRCGEFDACIEKAEALQGNPTRKREKYARREDAILHALELERKQLMERNPQLQASLTLPKHVDSKTSDAFRRGLNKYPLKGESSLFEEDDAGKYLSKVKGKKLGLKEDASEGLPRTRGLQDFGLRIAPSKKKISQHCTWDSLQKSYESGDDIFPEELIDGKILSENRKKKLQCGFSEGSLKRRDRRRPLVQVLQNSAKLPVSHPQTDNDGETFSPQGNDNLGAICRGKRSHCVYLPADSNDGADQYGYPCEEIPTAGAQLGIEDNLQDSGSSSEETETTSSGFLGMNDSVSSEREFAGPENPELDNISSGSGRHVTSGSSSFHVRDKFHGVSNEEMQLPSFDPQLHSYEQPMYAFADTGVSKWHMKGKRNVRNLAKRSLDVGDDKIIFPPDNCNGVIEGPLKNENSISVSKKARLGFSKERAAASPFYDKSEDLNDNVFYDDDDVIGKSFGHRDSYGFGRHRYPLTSKAARDHGRSHSTFTDSEDESYAISSPGWELDRSSRAARMAYWGYSGRRTDGVVDVVLKVQASNTGSHGDREHVPLVSLMSRLNGKAIVGHPIQIELLEDGSTFPPTSRINTFPEEGHATPPTWRTARRTTMQRVPRSNPSRSEMEGDDPEGLEAPVLHTRPLKKSYPGHLYQESSRAYKKTSSHKKSGKKVSLSNQKTRKLSALASVQRRGENGDALGGLIKGDGAVPLVTCVPVKVVFSRLLESIGRPSSAMAHRVPRDPL